MSQAWSSCWWVVVRQGAWCPVFVSFAVIGCQFCLRAGLAQIQADESGLDQGQSSPAKSVFASSGEQTLDQIKALKKRADQFYETGDYGRAAELYEQIVVWNGQNLGPDHPDAATALNNLAFLYERQGFFGKAEPLYERALAIRVKALGAEHEQTESTMSNLAGLYMDQGFYDKAKLLLERSLAIREKILGAKHSKTVIALNNLAFLYKTLGFYDKAKLLYERSLAIRKNLLGADHPYTATALMNLGSLYADQGFYEKAEQLLQRALAIKEKVLGLDHLDTAIVLNNLAALYVDQDFYGKAELLYERSLAIREKVLGPGNPKTATVLMNLARLHADQGFYGKAEPLYERSLAIWEKVLGPGHPKTVMALVNLADLYHKQGLLWKAEPLYQRALAIQQKALGAEHPDTATILSNLALLYQGLRWYEKAEPLYERALAIQEKALGAEHPDTVTTLNNLALLYERQGFYGKAEQLLQRALVITEKVLGLEHLDTAIALHNLAFVFASQGLYSKAESLYKRSLVISEKVLGVDHSSTSRFLLNLANLYRRQGLHKKAELLLRRALTIETTLIQREAPAIPREDRQFFVEWSFSHHNSFFSGALRGGSGAELALFSRLNRQGLLEEIEKRQAQLAALPGEQQEVAVQLRVVTQQLSSLALSSEQRNGLRKKQEQLERELYRLLPDLKPRVVEVSDVAGELPEGGVLVEFQRYEPYDGRKKEGERWGDARYFALVLSKDGSIEVVDLGLADLIDRRVEKALVASEQSLPDAEALWGEVGALVIQPLAKALVDVDTLVLSPDGQLNRLPFAALPAPGGGGLLAERFQLRLVTTGRELLDLKEPLGRRGKSPLVVANPDFDVALGLGVRSRRSNGDSPSMVGEGQSVFAERGQQRSAETDRLVWEHLPGTKKEGEVIAQLTNGRLLMDAQATAASVQQTKAPVVLHIASHAFFLADQEQKRSEDGVTGSMRSAFRGEKGLRVSSLAGESALVRSGIVMAGANRVSQRKEGEGGDDGYLTALEVAQLDWKGTELVVISACESGQGEINAGEGVYGLKRAIAVSGARSSLLSLWKVDDRATAAFMTSYYEKLKAGQGRADALASTQKEFREHPVPLWRHPYVWAAFQLSGDWRPIRF